MIPDLERVVHYLALVHPAGRFEQAARAEESVAAYRYAGLVLVMVVWGSGGGGGGGGGGGFGVFGRRRRRRRRGRRRRRADQVPPDTNFRLDHGAAAQDDVLGSVKLGAAGDFIARVGFNVLALWLYGGHCVWGFKKDL